MVRITHFNFHQNRRILSKDRAGRSAEERMLPLCGRGRGRPQQHSCFPRFCCVSCSLRFVLLLLLLLLLEPLALFSRLLAAGRLS
ncbi:hypothetical protein FKM82_003493 [Ascaphus truei]